MVSSADKESLWLAAGAGLVALSGVAAQSTNTSTANFFAPLNDLETFPPNEATGGQNFTRCCLQAVQAWVDHGDPSIRIQSSKNPDHVFSSADDFANASSFFLRDPYRTTVLHSPQKATAATAAATDVGTSSTRSPPLSPVRPNARGDYQDNDESQ